MIETELDMGMFSRSTERTDVSSDDQSRHPPGDQPVDTYDRDHRPGDGAGHEHPVAHDRAVVVAREKEEHGGIKVGSAFFGFLTATGLTVLLTAIAVAVGAAVGLATGTETGEATSEATSSSGAVGIVGAVLLLVVLFAAYYCGGYVAGRMARFDGLRQGLAVWLWALAVAVVVAVLGAVTGAEYDVLARLNSFPRIPVSEGDLTTGGIIAAVAAVVASLVGAMLGGLAGMRFHRRVDKTGLGR